MSDYTMPFKDVLPRDDIQVGMEVEANPFFDSSNKAQVIVDADGYSLTFVKFNKAGKVTRLAEHNRRHFQVDNGYWFVRNQVLVKGVDYE